MPIFVSAVLQKRLVVHSNLCVLPTAKEGKPLLFTLNKHPSAKPGVFCIQKAAIPSGMTAL
ncbi:hypothetical protein CLOSTMETH_01961 [[Clostridium] methylpentosum DSM 5476]|uniref:Uncharacterized protein n=1 Tax=[Clostridium] methylpentosum DSM 5476 TaxID=537013 RepID=C0EDN3_9FIRM|nr:hypothetical protein CLOSTMETH_01961 [[Clostridium] methylpentosum DSM 5476]